MRVNDNKKNHTVTFEHAATATGNTFGAPEIKCG